MQRLGPLARALLAWPWLPISVLALGLALTGVPEQLEGPDLLTLDRESGHGFTLSNLVALPFILAGAGVLLAGFWRRADALLAAWQRHPLLVALLTLQLCAGAALMLRSGVSTALVWWGPGVVLSLLAAAGLALFALTPRTH